MKKILLLSVCAVFAAGCSGAKVRSNFSSVTIQKDQQYRLGFISSDDVLADSIAFELVPHGFVVVERSRIASVIAELKLNLNGLLSQDNIKQVGNILNIDSLVFVNAAYDKEFPGKVASASVKIIDVESGVMLGGVSYQNGSAGMSGSIADSTMKQSMTTTARKIAQEIISGLNRQINGGRPVTAPPPKAAAENRSNYPSVGNKRVYLKDGSILTAKSIVFASDGVTVNTEIGTLKIPNQEIDRIE